MRSEEEPSLLFFLFFFHFLVLAIHAVLEVLDTFAETAHELWDFPATEYQQYDQCDEKDFLVADE